MGPNLPARLNDADLLALLDARADASEGIGSDLSFTAIDGEIDRAIRLAEAALVPAGSDVARHVVCRCLDVLAARRPEPQSMDIYVSLLGELPADLLGKAAKAALQNTTFHMLPTPGGFIVPVAAQWRERRERLDRLRRHRSRLGLFHLRRFAAAIWR
jgi:hypothetical protein